MAGRFRKVSVNDNWGHLSYTFSNGETFAPADGAEVYAKFPNGRVEILTVRVKRHTSVVSDMGHDYVANSLQYVVEADFHGVKVEIPVTRVLVHDTLVPEKA